MITLQSFSDLSAFRREVTLFLEENEVDVITILPSRSMRERIN